MNENRFSMVDAIKFGWDTVRNNIGFFIGLVIVAMLIQVLPSLVGLFFAASFPIIGILLQLTGFILGIVVSLGLFKICIKFCDGVKGKLDDLLSSPAIFLKYAAAVLLLLLIAGAVVVLFMFAGAMLQGNTVGKIITGVGLIALTVFAVIWGIKICLFPFLIIDREMGPIEAIKESIEITEGAKLQLFLFWLLWIGIVIGIEVVIFGLFFALSLIHPILGAAIAGIIVIGSMFLFMPVNIISYAHVYRQLAGGAESSHEGPAQEPGDGDAPAPDEPPKAAPSSGEKGVMYINLGS